MKMKENNTLTKDQSQNIELYNEISYQYIKDCCDKYLECNQSKGKLINEREILEIAIRCLIQVIYIYIKKKKKIYIYIYIFFFFFNFHLNIYIYI